MFNVQTLVPNPAASSVLLCGFEKSAEPMLKSCLFAAFLFAFLLPAYGQPTDIPNAQPGKCYAKCLMHDKYETVTEQVMLKAASSEAVAVPAQFETGTGFYAAKERYLRLVAEPPVFETVEEKILIAPPGKAVRPDAYEAVQEQVLIKPATKYYVVTDAVFETVDAPVEIEPAYMELEVLPQQYEAVVERLEVRPASTRWIRKQGDRDCLGADPDDCFVWCLVEVPAQYQTIYKQVAKGCDGNGSDDCIRYNPVAAKTITKPVQKVKTPAAATERVSAAEYQTITKWVLKTGATEPRADGPGEYATLSRQVLKRPARVREEMVPAEYKTIPNRKLLKAAATVRYDPTPAEYITVSKRQLVRKGGFPEWREILCGEKLTGYTLREIQRALTALGYYQGAADGVMSARTKTALAQFQADRNLAADGNVDFETLKALGISY